ncbi:hypothetical protein A3K48_06965 [candidate division WOR-1 bacterium RIFOXYA12_FULL_52_29]|uniref:Outer membrane protein beta-barrel domain-containing protein n=1 Tax=candidate division WOR-1 bacterium RIFOXYC12_FULL_54_18 TaxID=1802584 RepID=A0A1F4T849_UNCSA|nr:MAG: hypothetical protein A3K44_06965 [candidate division WOR-1 bacterium RIFOXYA2_FULL_51_19]OGC18262.1 MAG: hypothetical protein A3K48_06965 [candidate division WOR-1 bacterium RIFOXYA12_FULL_52_29]OGC27117.1 MAG: hypothetical protein A3K32_06960 [candidate division WOR-1 bacterium RIFOXYB2_FULL_45_9]OGC28679.1 MAG: hypothetical protein A3K49_06965 [candidate division WOR-1 bacterium RIFOXYC12_FULL_54_18]OGC30866.1 MAG: hypothetical protein A2346_05655 [candidate division WOR-1 bacterium R
MKNKLVPIAVAVLFLAGVSFATPSTQIWNPSTDVQGVGGWHFGVDDYFTVEDRTSGGYSFPTDLGLTYGLLPGLEIGVDAFLPQAVPTSSLVLNAKYGIPEKDSLPAIAIGGFGFGLQTNVTDQNVLYGVVAKTFPIGRFSAGYFMGNEKLLLDPNGNKDNTGLILTWDKAISDKLWLCVDYAGGKSALGAAFAGFSYAFSANTSVIFGYGRYNNDSRPTITTQLDINI